MFKLSFRFNDREESNLTLINQALAGMRLSKLSLEETEGFLATTRSYNPDGSESEVRRWYGLDAAELEGEMDPDGQVYQLEAAVIAHGPDAYHAAWTQAHPHLMMRSMTVIEYGSAIVFLVLYHAR